MVSRKTIKKGLDLLLQIPWTTLTAEQAHAALSVIRRCRDMLGREQACLRAFLGLLYKCAPTVSLEAKQRERVVAELKVLKRKNPHMTRPGNFYFQGLVALYQELEARGRVQYDVGQGGRGAKIMRGQSGFFEKLTDRSKSHYESRSLLHTDAKAEELLKKKEDALERKATLTEKIAEAKHNVPCLKIDSARLTRANEKFMEERWGLWSYSEANVKRWTQRILECPAPPSGREPPKVMNDTEEATRPLWFDAVCQRRESFEACGFVFGEGAERTHFKFLFARQANPRLIYFMPLTPMPALPLSSLAVAPEDDVWPQRFHSERGQYLMWDELEGIKRMQATSILAEVLHVGGRHAVTANVEAMPIEEFLVGLPELPESEMKPELAGSKSSSSVNLLAWMTRPLSSIGFAKPASKKEDEVYVDILDRELKKEKLTDEQIDAVHAELEWKRQEWEDQGIGVPGGHFRMSMRKGKFTHRLTGMSFNAVMVATNGKEVVTFCEKYNLPTASRYATKLFTEPGAIMIAQAWRNKMEHFYHIYRSQGNKDYVFSADDINSFVEDEFFERETSLFVGRQKIERLEDSRAFAPR